MLKNFRDIPAFCINLDRRTDRWAKFSSQPAAIEMISSGQLRRWSGVDGRTLNTRNDNRISIVCKKNILENLRRAHEELNSIGGVGCALSHISIWKWLVASEHDSVIIFEDDALLPIDFQHRFQIAINNSKILRKGEYDVLVPGNTAIAISHPERFLLEIDVFFSLSCYIITKDCAKKFLEHVYPIMEHIDLWMCLYKYIYGLRIYSIHTKWLNVRQMNTISDITPEDKCPLCNMKADYYKEGRIVSILDYLTIRGAQLGIGAGLFYYLWKKYGKN